MLVLTLMLACGDAPTSQIASPDAPAAAAPAAPPAPEAPPEPEAPPARPEGPTEIVYGLLGVDYPCMMCSLLSEAPGVQVEASSTLKGAYGAANLLSSDLNRAWCEGQPDAGVGASVTVRWTNPRPVDAVAIYGGFFKSSPLLRANGRLRLARLTSDGGIDELISFADPAVPVRVDPSTRQPIADWFSHMLASPPPWTLLATGADKPNTWLKLEILEVYPGEKYTDTCISRFDALLVEPE